MRQFNNFLKASMPNYPIIRGLLLKQLPGAHYFYQQEEAIELRSTGQFCFVVGNLTNDLSLRIINNICKTKKRFRIFVANEKFTSVIKSNLKLQNRYSFKHNGHLIHRLKKPEKIKIKLINNQLFDVSIWREYMCNIFGSASNYFQNGLGLCLTDNNSVICEAHAIISGKYVEYGVVTHRDYRGQGLATYLCQQLIQLCHQRGHTNCYWSCNAENLASAKIAEKLGFIKTNDYYFIENL